MGILHNHYAVLFGHKMASRACLTAFNIRYTALISPWIFSLFHNTKRYMTTVIQTLLTRYRGQGRIKMTICSCDSYYQCKIISPVYHPQYN